MITLYGVTEDGTSVPVQVTEDGKIVAVGQQGPPGPPGQDGQDSQVPGPPGPPGEIQNGDDVEFGSINADGDIQSGGLPGGGAENGAALRSIGIVQASRAASSTLWAGYTTGIAKATSLIDSDGTITAGENLFLKSKENKHSNVYFNNDDSNVAWLKYRPNDERLVLGNSVDVLQILKNRTAVFAGAITAAENKCGFNASGELIFFSRNQRYRAVVQNNNVMAEEYTREMELREKFQKPGTQDIVPED